MSNILCHVVGINSILKGKLINFLSSKKINLNVIDLDLITDSINQSKEMNEFYNEYEELSEKIKIKSNNKKLKDLEKNMANYWKDQFDKNLDSQINKSKNKSILIGLSTYFKNQRVNVKIDTKLKFFVRVDLIEHAKNIIENNLNNYKDEIINGNFPLDLLNLDHLIQKRENLIEIYTPSRSLRSASDKFCLKKVTMKYKSYGEKSFSFYGPLVWNSLPFELRSVSELNSFKKAVKTFLFIKAYPDAAS